MLANILNQFNNNPDNQSYQTMSFFGRIKNIFVEKIVQDEFYQPITQQEIYAVLNQKYQSKISQNSKRISQGQMQKKQQNVFDVALSVSQQSPEIEFRLLGYQPSIQTISNKVSLLKHKLNLIDSHLLVHYQTYLQNINKSLQFYSQGKQFYSTRKKAAELRFIIEKMNKVLSKSKVITKLNIHIKNLKNTLKLLQKVPNIKKLNLIQLKTIDLQKLQKINDEVFTVYNKKLLCLTNLSKYITKVNNQSFVYIINNLKMCLDHFDQQVYQDIMRSYLIIQPQTILQKLLTSLIEEKIRQIFDTSEGLQVLGRHLIEIMINIHKIIKWHIINRAVRNKSSVNQSQTLSSNQSENESNQPRRRLSVASDQSQERVIQLQLNQIVYIAIGNIKQIFNRSVDNCLTELTTDNIISIDIESKQLYNHLQIIAKISEICHSFTGLRFQKLKKALIDYFNRKESNLFIKHGKELINSIQQQKNDWNRLAFPNNFRFNPIDKLLFRWSKIFQIQQYKKIVTVINKLFCEDKSFFDQSSQSEQQQFLELKITKMQSVERLQKKFDEWKPSNFLQLYEGDVIICQSTYKLLGIFQKYTQLLIYTPTYKNIHSYYEHMLFLIQYETYFIFNSLLSAKYKNLFFEQISKQMIIEKIYTLKRFKSLYPKITAFVNSFKSLVEAEASQSNRLIAHFKRQIKEINNNQENHVLRAKVIATQACKYSLAYFHQILKANSSQIEQPAFKLIFDKVEDIRATLGELSILLLTESSQNLVANELQTIKSLFQSIRWYENYEELREYIQKIIGMIREAYQKLKSSNRGEIPSNIISFIFVFIWRTIITFSVKLFLENKANNKRENKLNFQKFLDQLYIAFENRYNTSLSGLLTAYNIFKSIFKILLNNNWQECKQLLIETMKKYDYIYPILISILQNSQYMSGLSQRQRQGRRLQFKEQIQCTLKQKK